MANKKRGKKPELTLTSTKWQLANEIYDRYLKEHGIPISRYKFKELLQVSEQEARYILFAIQHKHILNSKIYERLPAVKQTELVIADLHIPYHDKSSIQLMFDYLDDEKIKPNIIVILGDLIDCYKISRFSRDPSRKSLKKEITEGKEFLTFLRDKYPDSRIIYYLANHEQRLQKYIWDNAPELAELTASLLTDKLGVKELNIEVKDRPFQIGKLWHLHGHEKGGGSYNAEYITNVMWKYIHDNFIVGHWHRRQTKIFKSIGGKYWFGGAVGCLCQDMDYAILNRWTQGFAIINYDDEGFFNCEMFDIFDNRIVKK